MLDLAPDYVTLDPHDGSPPQPIQVIQAWIDPGRREAIKDPTFLAYLERRAAENIACIARFNDKDAIVIFAPALSSDRKWHFVSSNLEQTESHTFDQVARALNGVPMLTLSDA